MRISLTTPFASIACRIEALRSLALAAKSGVIRRVVRTEAIFSSSTEIIAFDGMLKADIIVLRDYGE